MLPRRLQAQHAAISLKIRSDQWTCAPRTSWAWTLSRLMSYGPPSSEDRRFPEGSSPALRQVHRQHRGGLVTGCPRMLPLVSGGGERFAQARSVHDLKVARDSLHNDPQRVAPGRLLHRRVRHTKRTLVFAKGLRLHARQQGQQQQCCRGGLQ